MATFEIMGPDGKRYRVTGDSQEGAAQALQQHIRTPPADSDAQEINADGLGQSSQWNLEQQKAIARARARRELARRELARRRGEETDPNAEAKAAALDRARKRLVAAKEAEENSGITGTLDAFGRGVTNSATLGFGDEIGAAARWAGGKILPWQSEVTYDEALEEVRNSDKATADAHPVADVAGKVTGAVGLGSGLVKAGLSPTAHAIKAGSGLGKVSLGSAAEGAILGGVQGFGDSNGGLGERAENAGYGLVGGAAVGGAMPAAMQVVGSTARRAVSPFLTNPERTRAVAELAKEGIETTAGQKTGSNALRYAESELGGQAVKDVMDRQGEQFTAAALRRAGINANRATPDVIEDAFQRIGQQFDDLAARNNLVPDGTLAQDLGTAAREYFSLVPETHRAPIVMDTIRDLGAALGRGNLDGAAYQSARSRIDRAARSSARDPQLSEALRGIRTALDDAMERSIATNNPGDVGLWKQVRDQYRNMLVLEKAATGAGEDAAQGLISPSALRSATVSGHGRRNYAKGKGPFGGLARAGEAVMKSMPNSGTAGRLSAQNLGANMGAMLGLGGAGYASGGDPSSMLAGAAAGWAAPRLAGKALMSPIVQALLGNQVAQGMQVSSKTRAIINALLNVEGAEVSPTAGRALLGK